MYFIVTTRLPEDYVIAQLRVYCKSIGMVELDVLGSLSLAAVLGGLEPFFIDVARKDDLLRPRSEEAKKGQIKDKKETTAHVS